jgi:SSS family solute:Na+ symporter
MHSLDVTVIVVYLLATLALGIYLAIRTKTAEDFFLAGKRLPFWAIGMSLVVSDIGAIEMIGGTGGAFRHGITQANYEWIGCIPAMIIGGLLFIPLYWRTGIYSVPEFLGTRFGPVVRTLLAIVWCVFLAALLSTFFEASAKMFEDVLGWDRWVTISVVAVLVGVYTAGGGLGAVVVTDVIQCVVLFTGGMILAFVGLAEVGGIDGLMAKIDASGPDLAHHLDLLIPVGADTDFPWTGVLLGLGLVLSPAYWLGNQAIVQRTLGAKSEWDAKASMLFGAFLKTIVPIAFVLPGLLGLFLISDVVDLDPDKVYPQLIEKLLPVGVRGILYAAFLAALMSSVDSYANSAATIFTRDIYLRFFGNEKTNPLLVGRVTCIVTILLGVALVPLVDNFEKGIFEAFQSYLAFFQGPTLVLLLAGVLWRRASAVGALTTLLGGIAVSATLTSLKVHFLHVAFWSFAASVVLMVSASLLRPDVEVAK